MARWALLFLIFAPLTTFAKTWHFAVNGQIRTVILDNNGWPRTLFASPQAALAATDPLFPLKDIPLKGKSGSTLWTVSTDWDWNWEIKFAEWVKTELNAHWWKANGIATDCADVVYSARWIFARANGLPMANHLITGQIFSHESVMPEWENLPTASDWRQDQKFLAALDYLLSQAFTHTLWLDSYPVAVTTASILPGGYHLYIDESTGHTQLIFQVGRRPAELPLVTLNSTVPRELRDLMEWAFFEQNADPNSRALMRMRWPRWNGGIITFTDPRAMPYYSEEQFSPAFIDSNRGTFWREVYYRLNPQADFDLIAQKTVQQIVDQLKARVPVVENGYRDCSLNPCAPGTRRYETWSTPSRDHRIGETVKIFDSLSSMINSWTVVGRIMRQPILLLNGNQYDGSDLMSVWRMETFSSDPNDTPAARWGQ
jgi:hypothetical protein